MSPLEGRPTPAPASEPTSAAVLVREAERSSFEQPSPRRSPRDEQPVCPGCGGLVRRALADDPSRYRSEAYAPKTWVCDYHGPVTPVWRPPIEKEEA